MQQPKQRAVLTIKLPTGETLAIEARRLLLTFLKLARYPVAISTGYALFGARGALLALVLSFK